jgi:hypothetical protein
MQKIDERYLQSFDTASKLDFIAEQLQEIIDMLDDVNNELCRKGFKATW